MLRVVQFFLGLTRPMQDADGMACFTVRTAAGRIALNEILRNIRRTILLVDLDGSFWDPVRWPRTPLVLCQIPRLFSRLGRSRLFMMAYLTGRASEQLRSFGMLVRGVVAWCQFGAERWQAGRQVDLVPVPPGLATAISALDGTTYSVERKTHAVAVHWTAADDDVAVGQLLARQQSLAEEHRLAYHPGNLVVELSPLGMSKKVSAACFARQFLPAEVIEGFVRGFDPVEQEVYEQIWASLEASGSELVPSLQSPYFIFVGDSAPDLGVFLLFDYLRGLGIPVLKVAVKGHKPLEDLADIVVDGPAGALQFVRELELHTAPWWLRFLRRSLGHAAVDSVPA
ncbi:hypothetical protein AB0C69_24070 [Actinomadura sp. NPDC048032]|uniref:hypothetical protein n=1 Tax=Actinomadura sp. NPDC048032 TaxID=3155747 RepID=UPI0034093867